MNRAGTQYKLHTELCMQFQYCTQVCYVRWNGDKGLNGLLINIKIKDLTLSSVRRLLIKSCDPSGRLHTWRSDEIIGWQDFALLITQQFVGED